MTLFVRVAGFPPRRSGPRPLPILFSLTVHGVLLALVAFGPAPGLHEKQKSLYEQVIAAHESKLVWYDFRKKLPAVSPGETAPVNPSDGFQVQQPQVIVSRPANAPAGTQLIWRPTPQIRPQPEVVSPNILSFRMPKILPPPPGPPQKLFSPPKLTKRDVRPAPDLPAPPVLLAKTVPKLNPMLVAPPRVARPKPKEFLAPKAPAVEAKAAPALPDAPAVATTLRSARVPMLQENLAAALANKPKPKNFTPPAARAPEPVAGPGPVLPDAPAVGAVVAKPAGSINGLAEASLASALGAKPKPRPFVPPPPSGGNGRTGGSGAADAHGAGLEVDDAPSLNAAAYGNIQIAVVGLHPADRLVGPLPESSRPAQFAAGPDVNGGVSAGGASDGTRLSVPGLTIRGPGSAAKPTLLAMAAPTSRENLAASVRAITPAPPPEASSSAPQEIRLAPPDPKFVGREVYTLAVQMPNITSYQGSWILWFAERERTARQTRGLRPPVPLHKVDPKYIPAAIDERIEGKVRLSAIIRVDGRVDQVELLRGVDPRLDLSATEALLKWEFAPAERDGKALAVEVVVEIPFQLAPRAARR